jgi:hypothetical protein
MASVNSEVRQRVKLKTAAFVFPARIFLAAGSSLCARERKQSAQVAISPPAQAPS